MADSSVDLLFKIKGDSSDARKDLNELRGSVRNNLAQIQTGFDNLGTNLKSIGSKLTVGVAAVGAAAVATVGALFALAKGAADAGSRFNDLSIKTGLSVETLSGLNLQAQQSGTSIETLSTGVFNLQKNMASAASGNKKLSAAFQSLGIDAEAGLKDTEGALRQLFKSLNAIPDTAARNAAGAAVMGKAYKELSVFFADVNGDMDAVIGKAREMGLVMSDDAAKAADEFGDTLDRLTLQAKGLGVQFGSALIPLFLRGMEALSAGLTKISPLVQSLAATIVPVIESVISAFQSLPASVQLGAVALAALAVAAGPVLIAVGAIVSSVGAIAGVLATISLPVAAVAAGVVAAVGLVAAAWATNFGGIREVTTETFSQIKAVVLPVMEAVAQSVQENVRIVTDFVQQNWPLIQQTIETVMGATRAVVQAVLGDIRAFWQAHGDELTAIVKAVWAILGTVVQTGLRNILDATKIIMQVINGDWAGAWETFKGIVVRTVSAIAKVLEGLATIVYNAVKFVATNLLTVASDFLKAGLELGKAIVDGLVSGIKGGITAVFNAGKSLAATVIGAAKSALRSQSPSQVFFEIGQDVVAGFVGGIESGKTRVAGVLRDLVAAPTINFGNLGAPPPPDFAGSTPRLRKPGTSGGSENPLSDEEIAGLGSIPEQKKTETALQGIQRAWADTKAGVVAAGKEMAKGAGQLLQNWVLLGSAGPNSVRKMTAAVLAGFAAEAAVAGLMETAKGFAALFTNPPAAAGHFTAAGIFGLVGGAAAIGGRKLAGNLFQQDARGSSGAPNQSRLAVDDRPQSRTITETRQQAQPVQVNLKVDVTRDEGSIVKVIRENYNNNGEMRQLILDGARSAY